MQWHTNWQSVTRKAHTIPDSFYSKTRIASTWLLEVSYFTGLAHPCQKLVGYYALAIFLVSFFFDKAI